MLQIYRIEVCRTLALGSRNPLFFPLSFLFAPGRHYCVDDSDRKIVANPVIIRKIQRLLKCKPKEAIKVNEGIDHTSKLIGKASIQETIEILRANGVTAESIIENPWLFGIRDLSARIDLILKLKPKNINDFVPLLILNTTYLKNIVYSAKKDIKVLPKGYVHRIYYFSDKLQTSPVVISKRFADNPFMLHNKFEYLAKNLAIFLEYDIKPVNILRDIGIFSHSEESIIARLKRVKAANISKVMPWMIKCLNAAFESAIRSRVDEIEALGKHDNVESFLVEHLDIDIQFASEMLKKHPRLSKRKVRKIKCIIDYLLSETDYSKEDIASTPRILFFSLETIKKRVEDLRMAGDSLPHLTKLTQGQSRFKKLLSS